MIIEDYTADVFPSLNKNMQKHYLLKLKDQPDIKLWEMIIRILFPRPSMAINWFVITVGSHDTPEGISIFRKEF